MFTAVIWCTALVYDYCRNHPFGISVSSKTTARAYDYCRNHRFGALPQRSCLPATGNGATFEMPYSSMLSFTLIILVSDSCQIESIGVTRVFVKKLLHLKHDKILFQNLHSSLCSPTVINKQIMNLKCILSIFM
ncbi:hypothetical protein Hanom_Chr03g00245351 [Helianthus anomalus]